MIKLSLFTKNMITFLVGSLIFLIGIGAIMGCIGGLVLIFAGTIICLPGISALFDVVKVDGNNKEKFRASDLIDLIKKNGKWAANSVFSS
jgi:hypothetical protein